MKEYCIRMFGDDLIHKQVYQAAWDEAAGRYDFTGMFVHVKDLIREADLAIINQETIFVSDPKKYSSFPMFGTPADLGDAIADAGFHVVLQASNHSLDKNLEGISDTVEYWESRHPGITLLGVHTSADSARHVHIKKIGDMKVALLNYAEKMNYHPMPAGKPYVVDRMRSGDRARVKKQIAFARERADLVIVLPHWGCEYLYEPIESQKKWAHFFAECGADLIIGTHPHVLQYTEEIRTQDQRTVPCLYSLGNFVSCQNLPGTQLGGMADVVIRYDGGKASVRSASVVPLVTHTNDSYSYFTVYPLSDYTDELAAENKLFTVCQKRFGGKRMDTAGLEELFAAVMEKRAMETAYFKKPSDVTKYNISGVWAALTGKNTKG